MGFIVMVGSGLLGLYLTAVGLIRLKKAPAYIVALILGIAFLCFAVWLGWPK